MTSFDLDDPLGDLLSDGSDDSFFDKPKTKTAKRASISKSPDKKTVSDLFGLEDSKEAKKDDWLGLEPTANPPALKKPSTAASPAPRPRTAKKISFEEDEAGNDILSTMGLDTKKPEAKTKIDAAKRSSVMESLLGASKEEKTSYSLDDLLQESKSFKKNDNPEVTQSSTQLVQPKPTFSSLETAPREGRRSRARSANMSDPLGLFETNSKPEPEVKAIPAKQEPPTEVLFEENRSKSKSKSDTNVSDVPDWLIEGAVKKTLEVEKSKSLPSRNLQSVPSEETLGTLGLTGTVNPSMDSLMTQQKLASSNLEYQNASMALQQQESQLLMALQLKKYEDNLGELYRKQQQVLMNQENQFSSLMERQFAKQQIMENNMRLQQERINTHIQMLLTQPGISLAEPTEEKEKVPDEISSHYEEMINHMKQRQHEEMFLLEESYKKQIATIEQSMESVENHLKMELDALTHKQKEKLENLEVEHQSEVEKYQKKIEELHKQHETELKQLRENNGRVVEEIKFEFSTIIENLKNSRNVEQSVAANSHEYTEKLDVSLKFLDSNSRSLENISQKVEQNFGALSLAKEESLRAKEKEIQLMRAALEKARELADKERAELMSLVRNLEIKLAEQSDNSREERFALQQAAATLASRASAMDREAEFNRKSLEREREQLKTLRETILAEQERSMQEITEEKLALHAERIRAETASKLVQNYDSQRAKAEMEVAIQVAKEAAEMTDRERENLVRQVRDVESLKRSLQDKEQRLNSRERDLELATEQANRKSLLGEKALEEARMLQTNYNEKLQQIQAQLSSLNLRERKLAQDKINVSKERLALHNSVRQMRKCGLCAVDNAPRIEEEDDMLSEPVEHDIPAFISVSDADIFRLQLQMSEEQLTVNADDRRNVNLNHSFCQNKD